MTGNDKKTVQMTMMAVLTNRRKQSIILFRNYGREEVSVVVTIISEQERKRMRMNEIKEEFDGKWIFTVNTETNPFSAIPAVVADKPYEDRDRGIYIQFNDEARYGTTGHVSLLTGARMFGFEVF